MATRIRANGMERRAFLTLTGAAAGAATLGGLPGILRAQKPPSFPKGTKLHLLEYVSFIPAADVELKRQGEEFGKLAGVDVTVELINFNDLNPRIASAMGRAIAFPADQMNRFRARAKTPLPARPKFAPGSE